MANIRIIIGCFVLASLLLQLANAQRNCVDKYTSWNDAGDGNTVYLDRHRLNCGGAGNAMKMFKLERRRPNRIRYKYTCCQLSAGTCSTRKKTNDYTIDGGGKVVYLDRQRVSCTSTGLINEFWLSRNSGHDRYRYEYYCCDTSISLRCYDSSTPYTAEGDRTNYYLDRQTVSCNRGYFLQSFRLKRNPGRTHMKYDIRCCRLNN